MNVNVIVVKNGALHTVLPCTSADQGHLVYDTTLNRSRMYGEPGRYEVALVLGSEIVLRHTEEVAG